MHRLFAARLLAGLSKSASVDCAQSDAAREIISALHGEDVDAWTSLLGIRTNEGRDGGDRLIRKGLSEIPSKAWRV